MHCRAEATPLTAAGPTARTAACSTARDAIRSTSQASAYRAALWLACVCASGACRGPAREVALDRAPERHAAASAEAARPSQAAPSAEPARDGHSAPSGDLTGAATHVDAPTRPPPAALPVASPSRPDVAEALRYDPNDPLGNLEAADVLDRGAAHSGVAKLVVPPRGCAIAEEPRRVWSKPGIASVAAFGGGFVLAGYTQAGAGDQVFVVYVTGKGKLEPVATLPLTQPYPGERLAAPGLSADAEQGVTVVYSDGSGTLFAQNLRVGAAYGGGAPTTLAHGVDTRFEPAVGYGKRGALIAYTLGSTPMRSMLVQLDPKGDVVATHDVTPPAMGAAAPAFVHGASPLWLVTGDPRNGLSPIARTPLDAEGKPGPAQVAAPVGMMSQPPQLAAAQADFGAFVLYTGLGSAATSAVGLVRITPKAQSPEAFVKGTAYGVLHAAAIGSKHAVLVAADAPLTPGKKPQHAIQVALLDADGQGPLLRVTGPSGDATHVALARGEQAGVALTFSAADGVYLTKLRCAGL